MAVSPRGLYLRVGILILAGLGLGLGFILFFTADKLGRNTKTYETYLRESVQGLDVGAAVRFRGVQLGQVTDINLVATVYQPPPTGISPAYQRVLVRFAIDLSRLRDAPDMERAVQAGLRIRLASTGLTGVTYLELDFVDPERFPVEAPPWTPEYPVIPSIPSTVAQVTNVAEEMARRISDLPIEQVLNDMVGLMTDLRRQVNEGEVAQASRAAEEMLTTVRKTVTDLNLPRLSAELQATIAEARQLIGSPEVRSTVRNANLAMERLQQGMQRLPAAIAQVESAARSINNTVSDVNADLTPTLQDLRAASGNLRDTTERLRRSPGAALLAPPPPPPGWARGGR
ncbi:MlaD family protein [Roseomonas xinghualingensis]|uniref:MlaD family protein n=1 Tax=Roseomonas xinghualingensis TaxID=2986475 RepID=UPI0021F0BE8F|nr:MlaD family protein [Roseomonas sp. SXEYE001]MCV4207921.1 MlaD family protein [Roseomonas sp. SXEYE001]